MHKDLFVEVDYVSGYIPQGIQPNPFMDVVNINGTPTVNGIDFEAQIIAAAEQFKTPGSGITLKNPDQVDGIALHVDLGIDPPANKPHLLTLYGDWGGSDLIASTEMQLPVPNPENLTKEQLWQTYPTLARVPLGNFMHSDGRIYQGLGRFQTVRKNVFFYSVAYNIASSNLHQFIDRLGSEHLGIRWNYSVSGMVFSHELGHYLTLMHWGKDEWGIWQNFKPNYQSVMNYASGLNTGIRFSNHETEWLNPPALREPDGTGVHCQELGSLFNYLNFPPFQIPILSPYVCNAAPKEVDWNFDGLFTGETVRAPLFMSLERYLFWGWYANNNQQNINLTTSKKHTIPKLFRLYGKIYMLSIDPTGRIIQRHGDINRVSSLLGASGSCQLGEDSTLSTDCVAWSGESVVEDLQGQTVGSIRALSVVWHNVPDWDPQKATLAYQQGNAIYTRTLNVHSDSRLFFSDSPALVDNADVFDTDSASSAEVAGVELNWLRVNPSFPAFENKSVVLGLFYLGQDRVLRWKVKISPSTSWSSVGEQNNNALFFSRQGGFNQPFSLKSSFSPSITNLPHNNPDPNLYANIDSMKTCGVFSRDRLLAEDSGKENKDLAALELWCLDPSDSNPLWRPAFSVIGAPPKEIMEVGNSLKKPSLVFHSPRYTDGNPIDEEKGYFMVITTGKAKSIFSSTTNQITTFVKMSKVVDSGSIFSDPGLFNDPTSLNTKKRFYYYNENGHQVNAVLYGDRELAAPKGLVSEQSYEASQSNANVFFIPLADGTYDIKTPTPSGLITGIRGGNDYQVMEKELCKVLHNTDKWPCEPCSNDNDCPGVGSCNSDGRCTPCTRNCLP